MTKLQTLEDKQQAEINFWRDNPQVSPGSNSIVNIANKMSDAGIFIECLQAHKKLLKPQGVVMELGCGQGWAACVYQRMFPASAVIATDISTYAIASVEKWERMLGVKLKKAYAAKSYATAEADNSIDMVFAIKSVHHFVKQQETLTEIYRILKPGGIAFYFYEPVTPKFLYPLAYNRVKKKRSDVAENVLIGKDILKIAKELGLIARMQYFPTIKKRGPLQTIYYAILGKIPALQKILPTTANFIFIKPK